jgi:hypothetical protein
MKIIDIFIYIFLQHKMEGVILLENTNIHRGKPQTNLFYFNLFNLIF